MARTGIRVAAVALLLLVLPLSIGLAATPEAGPPPAAPPPAPPPPEPAPSAAPPRAEAPSAQPPASASPTEAPPQKAPPAATPEEDEEEEMLPAPPPNDTSPDQAPPVETPKKPLQGPILLNFKDASVRAVLEYLSEAAGLVIVEEATVEGRVTVMSRQPLSVDEAVSLLNSILKAKGYAAIRTGRTLKIVTLDQAKKAALPVRTGTDPDKIELGDQMVTHIIPVQFADAAQLKRDLAALIPSYADLTANTSTNALILTDTQTNVRRFVEIIRALDSHMATVSEVRVFQLKYANAANAARLITDLFKPDQTAQGGVAGPFGGGRRSFMFPGMPGMPGMPGGPPSSQSEQQGGGGRQQKVTASSDDRTNTLVVSGPPDVLKVIDGIVKQLDANPTEEQAVFIYPLRNAKAANIEGVLNNLFGWSGTTSGRSMTSTQGAGTLRSGFNTSGRSTGGRGSSGSGSGGLGSGGLGSSRSGTGGFGSSGFRTGGTTAAATGTRGTMRLSTATAAAASDLVGQAYVVADEDTNSLLVTTASKNFERIKAILTDLDRPVPQVLIKVLIAEVTHDKTLDLGTEFSILNLRAAADGTKLSTDFSVAAQTGGIIYKVIDVGDYSAIFRALAGMGKLDVLSRPYILTSDNQEASIMVGQEVPFVTRSQLTEAGQTINTIEYDDIGIILTVTPHINPDGLVIMDVYPEISALTGTTVAISETVRAPVFARRAAQSRVAIRDGQTIVIGGLMEDRNTENVQKVPLLGDIPGLGILFSRTIREKVKTELLIFLTPHVAKVPDDLEAMSEDEQAGTKVIPKAVEKGAFEEHMRGMQRGAAPHPPAEAERESPPVKSEGGPPPAGARHDAQP